MQLSLEVKGLDKVKQQLERLTRHQIKQASAAAINDTAFKARAGMQDQMRRVFDRVNPYLVKSVQVEKATPDRLEASIGPRKMAGGGTDPQSILRAQVEGGQRRSKRFENALRSIGALPAGWLAVLPPTPYPGSVDARGDLKGRFAQQLIAHLSGTRRAAPRGRATAPAGPVRFFVAAPGQRLKPGIWAAAGRGVKPVLLFVRGAGYSPRLRMAEVVRASDLQGHFEKRLRYRIRQALGE